MENWQQIIPRFLNQTIWSRIKARILFAAISSGLVMLLLNWVDLVYVNHKSFCSTQPLDFNCLLRQLMTMITINNIQSYGVVFVAILYVLEGSDRKRQSHYEAWRILDAAANVETSHARLKALQDLNKDGLSLKGFDFVKADLEGIELHGADLRKANFDEANLKGADLRGADLREAILKNTQLTSGLVLQAGKASTTVVREVNLTGANLEGADLRGADLTGAILDYAWLKGTKIDGATKISPKWFLVWQIVNKKLSKTYLRDADHGVDISKANLTGAYLEGIDLARADLSGADLTGANFTRAYLARANLEGAIIRKTDFSGAYLVEANLTRLSRRGANFENAELTGAKHSGAWFWKFWFEESKSTDPASVFARNQRRKSRVEFSHREAFIHSNVRLRRRTNKFRFRR